MTAPRRVTHLSASALSDWLACPMRWYGRRVAKWPSPPSVDATIGRIVHAAAAAHHSGQDARMAVLTAWTAEGGRALPLGTLERCMRRLIAYVAHNPHAEGDRPEVKFRLLLDGLDVPLLGYIDLLRGDEIHELKTTRFGVWRRGREHAEMQATAYWWAAERLTGRAPSRVVYHVVPGTGASVQRLETTRTAEQVAELLATCATALDGMRTGELEARCKPEHCAFPDHCYGRSEDDERTADHGADSRAARPARRLVEHGPVWTLDPATPGAEG